MSQAIWFPALIVIYAAVSGYGLYLLKASQEFLSTRFVIWIFILRLFPLSIAFPTAAGALIIATQIAGVYYLKESLQPTTVAGIALIAIGIILIYVNTAKTHG
jgi:multidrug transporter EmrE-like cation transporter